MEDNIDNTVPEEEQQFEISPEEATRLDDVKPVFFNRKKLLITICIAFSVIICGGLIINSLKPKNKNSTDEKQLYADRQAQSNEFLSSLQNKAIRNRIAEENANKSDDDEEKPPPEPEPLLPPASINNSSEVARNNTPQPMQQPPPPQQYQNTSGGGGSSQQAQQPTHFHSPLVPQIQGSLFSQGSSVQQQPASAQSRSYAEEYFSNPSSAAARSASVGTYGNQASSEYFAQNDQSGKQSFYNSENGGVIFSGDYIGENSIWVGTIIPGILQTAINTDLPGNVLARTTQNIYDSLTGKTLLIPQGTLLIARYNSSISYSQSRVQIVWDTLIRPDGYQVNLDGANAVDRLGMSGQAAKYHENWFEYIKAAGIITMFSIANSSMAETAAKLTQGERTAAIAEGNAGLVNQLSGSMVGRAMNIQPTLTVENGTLINIMLNKSIYMPPLKSFSVNQKYILKE